MKSQGILGDVKYGFCASKRVREVAWIRWDEAVPVEFHVALLIVVQLVVVCARWIRKYADRFTQTVPIFGAAMLRNRGP